MLASILRYQFYAQAVSLHAAGILTISLVFALSHALNHDQRIMDGD